MLHALRTCWWSSDALTTKIWHHLLIVDLAKVIAAKTGQFGFFPIIPPGSCRFTAFGALAKTLSTYGPCVERQQAICWSSGKFRMLSSVSATRPSRRLVRRRQSAAIVAWVLPAGFCTGCIVAMKRWGLAASALCGAAAIAFLGTSHAASPLDVAQVSAIKAGRFYNHISQAPDLIAGALAAAEAASECIRQQWQVGSQKSDRQAGSVIEWHWAQTTST